MKLEPLRLTDLSAIEVSYHRVHLDPHDALVVSFKGRYGVGSQGNPDAALMEAMGQAGLAAFAPSGLVIDLRELDYRWGDMLESVLSLGGRDLIERARAVVVGPKCREAIGTLIFGCGSSRDVCEAEGYFDRLEAALEHLRLVLQDDGLTPLHRAAEAGDEAAVRDLLESGADVNARDREGDTALHVAATVGALGAVKALLGAGADPGAGNDFWLRPIHRAGSVEVARALLAAGADPNVRTRVGCSPLHYARSPQLIRVLIEAGADPALRDRTSLLHRVRDSACAGELLRAGAPIDLVDEHGCTALDEAERNEAQFRHQAEKFGWDDHRRAAERFGEVAALLIEHGARRRRGRPADPNVVVFSPM